MYLPGRRDGCRWHVSLGPPETQNQWADVEAGTDTPQILIQKCCRYRSRDTQIQIQTCYRHRHPVDTDVMQITIQTCRRYRHTIDMDTLQIKIQIHKIQIHCRYTQCNSQRYKHAMDTDTGGRQRHALDRDIDMLQIERHYRLDTLQIQTCCRCRYTRDTDKLQTTDTLQLQTRYKYRQAADIDTDMPQIETDTPQIWIHCRYRQRHAPDIDIGTLQIQIRCRYRHPVDRVCCIAMDTLQIQV